MRQRNDSTDAAAVSAAAPENLREFTRKSQALRARRIRQLRRQALAALGAPTGNHSTTTRRRHARAKSVRPTTAKAFGLIGAFHGERPVGVFEKRRASVLVCRARGQVGDGCG